MFFMGDLKVFIYEGLVKERNKILDMFFIKRWFYRGRLKAVELALDSLENENNSALSESRDAFFRKVGEAIYKGRDIFSDDIKKQVH